MFVDGPGMMRSSRFAVPPGDGPFRVDVRPGSAIGRAISGVVLAGGAGAVVAAIVLYVAASRDAEKLYLTPGAPGDVTQAGIDHQRTLGLGLMVGGGVAIVGGIVGVILTRTRVTVTPSGRRPSVAAIPGGVAF